MPGFFLVPWAGPKKPSPMATITQHRSLAAVWQNRVGIEKQVLHVGYLFFLDLLYLFVC
jgi:hypothetical protein